MANNTTTQPVTIEALRASDDSICSDLSVEQIVSMFQQNKQRLFTNFQAEGLLEIVGIKCPAAFQRGIAWTLLRDDQHGAEGEPLTHYTTTRIPVWIL